jgi:hypothetical protein
MCHDMLVFGVIQGALVCTMWQHTAPVRDSVKMSFGCRLRMLALHASRWEVKHAKDGAHPLATDDAGGAHSCAKVCTAVNIACGRVDAQRACAAGHYANCPTFGDQPIFLCAKLLTIGLAACFYTIQLHLQTHLRCVVAACHESERVPRKSARSVQRNEALASW